MKQERSGLLKEMDAMLERPNLFPETIELIKRAITVQERAECPMCKGTGIEDSGGFTPWGQGIEMPCPLCSSSNT